MPRLAADTVKPPQPPRRTAGGVAGLDGSSSTTRSAGQLDGKSRFDDVGFPAGGESDLVLRVAPVPGEPNLFEFSQWAVRHDNKGGRRWVKRDLPWRLTWTCDSVRKSVEARTCGTWGALDEIDPLFDPPPARKPKRASRRVDQPTQQRRSVVAVGVVAMAVPVGSRSHGRYATACPFSPPESLSPRVVSACT